jgi:hypothetical protein
MALQEEHRKSFVGDDKQLAHRSDAIFWATRWLKASFRVMTVPGEAILRDA